MLQNEGLSADRIPGPAMKRHTTPDYNGVYNPPDSPVADIGDGSNEPVLTATDSSLHAIHGGIASDLTRGSSGGPGKSISELEFPSSTRTSIHSGSEGEIKASTSMLLSNGLFNLISD